MKMTITWEEILKDDNMAGRIVEIHEVNYVYRGLIGNIKIENEKLFIDCKKTRVALTTDEDKKKRWKHSVTTRFFVSNQSQPSLLNDGRISFIISNLSFGIIYPQGFEFHSENTRHSKA
jgi:hypothetical protein